MQRKTGHEVNALRQATRVNVNQAKEADLDRQKWMKFRQGRGRGSCRQANDRVNVYQARGADIDRQKWMKLDREDGGSYRQANEAQEHAECRKTVIPSNITKETDLDS